VKINYIVAMYFGERRFSPVTGKFDYLLAQLDFVKSLSPGSPVSNIVFSVNIDNETSQSQILEIIKSAELSIDHQVIFRENSGFSYGNWNDVLIRYRHHDFDYHFLIEDDYVPRTPQFYVPFVDEMIPGVGFVCQRQEPDGFLGFQSHPGVANGLISTEALRKTYSIFGRVLWVDPDKTSYIGAVSSQVFMMNLVSNSGFTWTEISDDYSKPFWDIHYGLWERGSGKLPPVIIPIGVDLDQEHFKAEGLVNPDWFVTEFGTKEVL
jgi:hypothetical protein